MVFQICFALAVAVLGLMIAFTFFLFVSKKRIKYPIAFYILLTFLGGTLIFFPIYWDTFSDETLRIIKSIFVSAHTAVVLFTLNAGFDYILDVGDNLAAIGATFKSFYNFVAAIFYILAPIMTAGFVLSFLKSFKSLIRFKLSAKKEVFIFSELNKRTANLAISIKEAKCRAVIVFCDVSEKTKEDNNDLIENLLDVNAIMFKKDITALNLKHHSKDPKKGVHFFIISEDEEKNLIQYNALLKAHSEMENGKIYLFSRSSQGDLSFNQFTNKKIKCRKYDSDFLIIYNYLYERGVNLFKTAREVDGKKKQISIAIIGFGLNGKMLTKALAWFCQMDGYELEINVYDADEKAESRFAASAPELLNKDFEHPTNPEEAQYIINIHGGVEVGTKEFIDEINLVAGRTTFVFTCLGDDERNLDAAMKLRMILERHQNKAPIVSVVYNNDKDYIKDATNFKGQSYGIECIGSYEHTYSYEFVINSQLEKAAIGVHTRYDSSTMSLFSYAYNFRSSCASAIHEKARAELGVNGSNKKANERTPEEITATEILEHKRWSAWIRSEGYIYDPVRNDLAKTHHDLRFFSDLDETTRRKDSIVGIRKDDESNN